MRFAAFYPKKKPINKVQVGIAPSPDLTTAKSKIGSLENAGYKPGGGDKKILNEKLQWRARSRVGSLDNAAYKPKPGEWKIESLKLDFNERAKAKIGSLTNANHKPGGGDIKIFDDKYYLKAMASSQSHSNYINQSMNLAGEHPNTRGRIGGRSLVTRYIIRAKTSNAENKKEEKPMILDEDYIKKLRKELHKLRVEMIFNASNRNDKSNVLSLRSIATRKCLQFYNRQRKYLNNNYSNIM